MKRILLSLITILAVGAIVIQGTQALFSDTETSTGNTFSAGTIDLKVNGNDDPDVVHISLGDMKPGDGVGGAEHSTINYSWTLSNAGSLTGQPWIEIINLVDNENSCNEPELAVPDTTCGALEGELGDNLYLQINAAGSGGFVYPNQAGCIAGRNCPVSTWAAYGPIGQGTWENIAPNSATAPMVLEFSIPESVGNIIQSDGVEFDIVLHLDQV